MDVPLGMPPQPILPPAPSVEEPMGLTAEEEKMLQHLRGLQAMDMELTESMAKRLEELAMREAKVQSNKTLTHGHLNKLNKLKTQVATAAQKVKDLDGEWMAFVNTTITKVRHHGEMYQNCRADLMEHYNAKLQELAVVKQEMKMASQSLLGPQWTEPIIPEAPDLEQQFAMLQETMNVEGHTGQIDLTEEMEDEELLEEEAQQGGVWEDAPQGTAPFSWLQFAIESGKSTPQGEGAGRKGCQRQQEQRQGQRGQVGDMTEQDSGLCCELAFPFDLVNSCIAFRHQVEQFWHSHFGGQFTWTDGVDADDGSTPGNDLGTDAYMNESTQGVPFDYLEGAIDHVSDAEPGFTWVAHRQRQKVETKFEPLIFSVGSFDSLQSMEDDDGVIGCDQGNVGLIKPKPSWCYEQTLLRDGTEGNLDLCASQGDENFSHLQNRSETVPLFPDVVQDGHTWCNPAAAPSQTDLQYAYDKRVGFCDSVEVRCFQDDQNLDFVIEESCKCDILRHFWHLDGQITTWTDLQRVITRLVGRGIVDGSSNYMEVGGQHDLSDNEQLVESGELEGEHKNGIWWQGITQMCTHDDPRPEFVATWFLALTAFMFACDHVGSRFTILCNSVNFNRHAEKLGLSLWMGCR